MSINPYVAFIMLLAVALVQTQFLPALLPGVIQFVPDLTLLLIVSWALLLDWRLSLPLAFGTGLLIDLLTTSLLPMGLNSLLFSLLVVPISYVSQTPYRINVIRSVPVALGAALLYRAGRLLAEQFLGYNAVQTTTILQVVLPVVILDGALMILVFVLVRSISRIKAPRD